MDFLFKTNVERDRRPNVVNLVVWSALIVGGWVVMMQSRKSYLDSAVFLVLFKDE